MIIEATKNRDAALSILNEQENLNNLGIPAFREGLADNLTHYMAEFLLKIPVTSFYYREETSSDGHKKLTSPGFGRQDMLFSYSRPWLIKEDLTPNPIELKQRLEEMPAEEARKSRERTEAKGFYLLESQIFQAEDDSYLAFVSPPLQENGYSITYLGKIRPIANRNHRLVEMVACFNNLDFPQHQQFLQKLGKPTTAKTPEDFLLNPVVLSPQEAGKLGINNLSDLVLTLYSLDPAKTEIAHDFFKAQERLARIKSDAIIPSLDNFIKLLTTGQSKEKIDRALNAMEFKAVICDQNLWVPAQGEISQRIINEAMGIWHAAKQAMPEAGGSCPATESRQNLEKTVQNLLQLSSPHDLLNFKQTENNYHRCQDCSTAKGSYGCCKGCPFE